MITNTIEKMAKTVDDAIEEALKELQATKDEVEIEILDAGSKGFLGIGSKPAKVLVKRKFDPVYEAKTFLREIFACMQIPCTIETELKNQKDLNINIVGSDLGVLIGKRGQTLDSLQYLTNLVVNKGAAPFIGVTLDAENYRRRRRETLETLAINLSKKVKATHKEVVLEPMSSYERRIIHSTLQNNRFVTTSSDGQEPYRHVVIKPKN